MSNNLTRLSDVQEVYDEHGHHIGRTGVMASGDLKLFKKSGSGFLPISDRRFTADEREAAADHIAVSVRRLKPMRPLR